ncbi:MAG: integrase arm-type DNA-binding domain-containing protein [Mailhella sp.]|nr:integrase arm-type DNA-binding domain-containing protein [Mailhella sp.]
MARLIKPLTALQVQNAKPRAAMYKLFDGGGLFLRVNPSGNKYWKMKYRKNDGKESLLTFGRFPEVSLKQARRMRDEARAQRAAGLDPGQVRKERKAALRNRAGNSFEAVSHEWLEIHSSKVKPQSLRIYRRILENCVFPFVGGRPAAELKTPDILALLRNFEAQGRIYLSRQISMLCGMVMRYAVAVGKAEADPTPSLRGSLKAHRVKHRAAMTEPKGVGRLLRAIDAYPGSFVISCALKIAPYVFVRPGELQCARWADIDFESGEWRYTVSKTGTPHIVPLAPQVLDILRRLHAVTGSKEWVFPHQCGKAGPMGRNSLLVALRAMGIRREEMTPHGFRAMARTLLDEELHERCELIEQQLAHKVRDPNGRAYNRTAHLAERRHMMEHWAQYLDKLRAESRPFEAERDGTPRASSLSAFKNRGPDGSPEKARQKINRESPVCCSENKKKEGFSTPQTKAQFWAEFFKGMTL